MATRPTKKFAPGHTNYGRMLVNLKVSPMHSGIRRKRNCFENGAVGRTTTRYDRQPANLIASLIGDGRPCILHK